MVQQAPPESDATRTRVQLLVERGASVRVVRFDHEQARVALPQELLLEVPVSLFTDMVRCTSGPSRRL